MAPLVCSLARELKLLGGNVTYRAIGLAVAVSICACGVAWAAETITYTYDVKGRLTQVKRDDGLGNEVLTNYTYDRADSRTRKQTTGSPN